MNRTIEQNMDVNGHLTEEELYELLVQPDVAGGAKLHLAGCERCASEFAVIRESLDGFQVAARGLAEAKFSPILQVRGGFLSGIRQSMMAWPMGLAAAGVLLAASVTMVHRAGPSAVVNTASVQAAPLESDDALLDGINQDLSTSVPPSLEPLSVASTEAAGTVSKKN
jgi:hypothetical protein